MVAFAACLGDAGSMPESWYEFRGFARDTVRAARQWYARFLPPEGRLLDLGCGRGEFLEVARAAGWQVEGVDNDPAMLGQARGDALHEADLLDFLQRTPDTFDAISALHVVEHLAVAQTAALIRLAEGRLNDGGRLILATPNPGSWPTLGHEFWRDPTHVRPYDVELLEYFCQAAGLELADSGVNPESERGLPVDLADLDLASRDAEPGRETDPAGAGPMDRWLGGRMAASAYAHGLESALHRARMDLDRTRDELRRVAGIMQRALDVAYEPSEIYVVARKR